MTLKPFTKSEVPYQKPEVTYQKPEVTHKKPKAKPRRPSGQKQRPKIHKYSKINPNFSRYPDTFPGNSPSVFPGSTADIFSGNNPDIFSSNSPDIFSENSQSSFHGNNGDVFSGNKPDIFSGREPDSFSGKQPNLFPEKTTQPTTKKPESADGKYSASYPGGPQGLQLPSLEGLDGYSVKLRTNHGSGYSLQGFSSSPGKSQKVKISKTGKSTPVNDSESDNPSKNPFVSEDEFNHSLESHGDFPRPNVNRPLRNARPKPIGRKRRTKIRPSEQLAFFMKNPPTDPNVVLFKPHSPVASKPKTPKRSSFFRPAEGLRL